MFLGLFYYCEEIAFGKHLEGEELIFLIVPHWKYSGKEVKQARRLGAGTNARSQRHASHLLAPHSSFSLLSYRSQNQLSRSSAAHKGLSRPMPLFKKMPYRLA